MAKQHRKGEAKKDRTESSRQRTCIVHRSVKSPDEMLRFVLDPDDTVTPDLKSVLPGRGVWVTATKTDVDFAVEKGFFSRGFKGLAKTDATLSERVDVLLEAAALQSLSMVSKAGLVTTGFEKVMSSLGASQLRGVIFALDGAKDGVNKVRGKLKHNAREAEIAVHQSLPCEQLSLALGRSNVIHAALLKGGATEQCLKNIRRLEVFRTG